MYINKAVHILHVCTAVATGERRGAGIGKCETISESTVFCFFFHLAKTGYSL